MKYSWHGHSVVQLETISGHRIIIDPFIRDNPATDLKIENINVDYIILTHAHNDHVGDTLEIALKNDATLIAMVEICDYFESQGLKTHGMNIGGSYTFPFGKVKFVPALHSSSYHLEDGSILSLGLPTGVVIDDGVHKVYHAGDTALFSDMSLIGPVDVAFLPIGDNYTMGIDDAIKAVSLLKCEWAIPIHYNTFPIIEKNPYDFINRLDEGNGLVPHKGQVYNIN